jgi:very-short-patch-repair endonuclease
LEKSRKTCNERYGTHHTGAVEQFIKARKTTCLKRYGKTSFLATQACRDRLNEPDVAKKRHETMKRNKTYATSSGEERLYVLLCERFGKENVMRQHVVGRWAIDFYVKSVDRYVQFDGVYWHGLDRPLSVIAEHKTSRDVIIHKKHATDIEQNTFFSEQKFSLIRITDKQLNVQGPRVLSLIT